MVTYISQYFGVSEDVFEDYGALNISIVNDLPLFIDPFLLFHSENPDYQKLHEGIIEYIMFLRDRAAVGGVSEGQLRNWYCFPEVKQNWLGFSESGNNGAGLGIDFARTLHASLVAIFPKSGKKITEGVHLEKVCLISDGVGRDNISDFTTNLILDYLCSYTERFAAEHLPPSAVREVWIDRSRFNYKTQAWVRKKYKLPWVNNDFVVLTPRDILTRDENWINRSDMINDFDNFPNAISDPEIRATVFNYFQAEIERRVRARPKPVRKGRRMLPLRSKEPTRKERSHAAQETIKKFPDLIDYFILHKELNGDQAKAVSEERVAAIEYMLIERVKELQAVLCKRTEFYLIAKNTYEEAHARLGYLKDVIENKGGHRFFYNDSGEPIEREKDLHVLYRLVWYGTPSDAGAEANDGRGPVDFKISRGRDKTLVEMKLAKNTKLEQNLLRQAEIYKAASDAKHAIKAIIYFTAEELLRVNTILKKIGLVGDRDVVLIDARRDNKPSGSKAK